MKDKMKMSSMETLAWKKKIMMKKRRKKTMMVKKKIFIRK